MAREQGGAVEKENRPGFWRSSLNPWTVRTKNNPERVAFVLHRVTGFIILAFLLAHILETDSPVWSQIVYHVNGWAFWNHIMGIESGLAFRIGEFIVAGAVLFHAPNGIRLLLTEFFGVGVGRPGDPKPPYVPFTFTAAQRQWLYAVFVVWIVLWIIAGVIIFT
ncbi:Succinate:quinone oxidoreductase, cytochrome b subunit C [Acidilobus saccharovorans 345-15]|uniref:Succinate:quinone oxidoreductase, cytochrome b subunit C n=1 Tax=Acidilobus saccharovorans (strain DSM 16705 / JCM 18335 / VKM B-2471 / 345-15) TaxID=666510 RepID=D9PZ60_ACIS3|nr:succinate dehydrogenase [Acidilobus saccharovorans]ADL19847.1 Succinate:quinone oxidoreductase, cytochrome b subunit C [Acidilobus saccharovorans 345-15]